MAISDSDIGEMVDSFKPPQKSGGPTDADLGALVDAHDTAQKMAQVAKGFLPKPPAETPVPDAQAPADAAPTPGADANGLVLAPPSLAAPQVSGAASAAVNNAPPVPPPAKVQPPKPGSAEHLLATGKITYDDSQDAKDLQGYVGQLAKDPGYNAAQAYQDAIKSGDDGAKAIAFEVYKARQGKADISPKTWASIGAGGALGFAQYEAAPGAVLGTMLPMAATYLKTSQLGDLADTLTDAINKGTPIIEDNAEDIANVSNMTPEQVTAATKLPTIAERQKALGDAFTRLTGQADVYSNAYQALNRRKNLAVEGIGSDMATMVRKMARWASGKFGAPSDQDYAMGLVEDANTMKAAQDRAQGISSLEGPGQTPAQDLEATGGVQVNPSLLPAPVQSALKTGIEKIGATPEEAESLSNITPTGMMEQGLNPTNLIIAGGAKAINPLLGKVIAGAGKPIEATGGAILSAAQKAPSWAKFGAGALTAAGAGGIAVDAVRNPNHLANEGLAAAGILGGALALRLGGAGMVRVGENLQGIAPELEAGSTGVLQDSGRLAQQAATNLAANATSGAAIGGGLAALQGEDIKQGAAQGAAFTLPGGLFSTLAAKGQVRAAQAKAYGDYAQRVGEAPTGTPYDQAHADAVSQYFSPAQAAQFARLRGNMLLGDNPVNMVVLSPEDFAQATGADARVAYDPSVKLPAFSKSGDGGTIFLNAAEFGNGEPGGHETGHATLQFAQEAWGQAQAQTISNAIEKGLGADQLAALKKNYIEAIQKNSGASDEDLKSAQEKLNSAATPEEAVDAHEALAGILNKRTAIEQGTNIVHEQIAEHVRRILAGRPIENFTMPQGVGEKFNDLFGKTLEGLTGKTSGTGDYSWSGPQVKEAARLLRQALYQRGGQVKANTDAAIDADKTLASTAKDKEGNPLGGAKNVPDPQRARQIMQRVGEINTQEAADPDQMTQALRDERSKLQKELGNLQAATGAPQPDADQTPGDTGEPDANGEPQPEPPHPLEQFGVTPAQAQNLDANHGITQEDAQRFEGLGIHLPDVADRVDKAGNEAVAALIKKRSNASATAQRTARLNAEAEVVGNVHDLANNLEDHGTTLGHSLGDGILYNETNSENGGYSEWVKTHRGFSSSNVRGEEPPAAEPETPPGAAPVPANPKEPLAEVVPPIPGAPAVPDQTDKPLTTFTPPNHEQPQEIPQKSGGTRVQDAPLANVPAVGPVQGGRGVPESDQSQQALTHYQKAAKKGSPAEKARAAISRDAVEALGKKRGYLQWVRGYFSPEAKGPGGLRITKGERVADLSGSQIDQRLASGKGTLQDIPVIPVEFKMGKDRPYLRVFRPDLWVNNLEQVLDAAPKTLNPWKGLKGPDLDAAVQGALEKYVRNHVNGFSGDGLKPLSTPGPDYFLQGAAKGAKGEPLDADPVKAKQIGDMLNMALGARSADMGKGAQKKALALNLENQGANYAGEFNSLRRKLPESVAQNLSSPFTENLSPEAFKGRVTDDPPSNVRSVRPSSLSLDYAKIFEPGRPSSEAATAGFMPKKSSNANPTTRASGPSRATATGPLAGFQPQPDRPDAEGPQ